MRPPSRAIHGPRRLPCVIVAMTIALRLTLTSCEAAIADTPTALRHGPSASVDQILDRFVQALGGRRALEQVTSMVFAGVMKISGYEEPAVTREYFKYPNHFAFIAEIPGYGAIRTIYDGKTAWNVDPKKGVTPLSGPRLSDVRRRADIHWNLKLKKFYPGLNLVGREKVDGKDAWALESTVDHWTYRFYFDADSGLLVRFDTDTHQPGGTSSISIGDYRRVGPVRFSFAARLTSPKVNWSRQLNQVKFNVGIPDSVFTKPS